MTKFQAELSEHDALVLMMARFFIKEGYSDIRADIPGWLRPDGICWTDKPEHKYFPDLTCTDNSGKLVILEAETCESLATQHTKAQFRIFSAHASNTNGRFEVVVPKNCNGNPTNQRVLQLARQWGLTLQNIWTPS